VSEVVGTRDSDVEELEDGGDTWVGVDVSDAEAELEDLSGVLEGVLEAESTDETPVPFICLRAWSLFRAAQSNTVDEAHDATRSKKSQKGPALGNMLSNVQSFCSSQLPTGFEDVSATVGSRVGLVEDEEKDRTAPQMCAPTAAEEERSRERTSGRHEWCKKRLGV
jgi:hypothetical protein